MQFTVAVIDAPVPEKPVAGVEAQDVTFGAVVVMGAEIDDDLVAEDVDPLVLVDFDIVFLVAQKDRFDVED